MKNLKLKTILVNTTFSLVAGFSMGTAAGQHKKTMEQVQTLKVQTAKLQYSKTDLQTEQGRENLQRRISSAAKAVCGSLNIREAGSLNMVARNKQCYQAAIESAEGQIANQDMLAMSE